MSGVTTIQNGTPLMPVDESGGTAYGVGNTNNDSLFAGRHRIAPERLLEHQRFLRSAGPAEWHYHLLFDGYGKRRGSVSGAQWWSPLRRALRQRRPASSEGPRPVQP